MLNYHHNPASSKIKRRRNRNESVDGISESKQNIPFAEMHSKNNQLALKQISINMSSSKQTPLKLLTTKQLRSENSVITKSISNQNFTVEKPPLKYIQQIQKQNESLKKKIKATNLKIQQLQRKNISIKQKYNKLKEIQSNKMRIQVRKLNIELCNKASQQQKDWNSILEISTNQQKQQQSRMKLSQMRQKIQDLDLSGISKFAKQNKKESPTYQKPK